MKSFRLKINSPCTENWDEMHFDNNGKHCASCKKVVIDFSRMSESQVAEQFKNTVGKICGRFRKEQLQLVYEGSYKIKAPWYTKFFIKMTLTGLLTLKSTEGNAQSDRPIKEQIKDDSGKNKIKSELKKTDNKKYISGRILDRDSREALAMPQLQSTVYNLKQRQI